MIGKSTFVAEILLKELYSLEVEYVFLVPGAQIIPIVFKLYEKEKNIPKPIIANHELAAGYMALGYAKASGKIGVAFSIGGPGAAYMVGAGITAKADDVPLLLITGNIPPENFGKGEFQDASPSGTNDSKIFQEAIGNSFVCDDPQKFTEVLSLVYLCEAQSKPFHIQIPISIQRSEFSVQFNRREVSTNGFCPVSMVPRYLKTKTILFLGRKTLNKINREKLLLFVRKHNIPVITDMKTRGIISEKDNESIGYVGFNSDLRALEVFNSESVLSADEVISIGVNNHLLDQYIESSKITIEKINPSVINVWMDTILSKQEQIGKRHHWLYELNLCITTQKSKLTFPDKISYSELFQVIINEMPENTVFCLDSGQVRRAGSIYISCKSPRSLLQSETLSPMGLGICSSIGAQLAKPNKYVVSIIGDGSMRMHGMELATAVRYNLPIIFILCDNQSYASVKAQEEAKKTPVVDWGSFANMIGIKSYFAKNKKELTIKLNESLIGDEPVLIWTLVPDLLDDELVNTQSLEYKNWLSKL